MALEKIIDSILAAPQTKAHWHCGLLPGYFGLVVQCCVGLAALSALICKYLCEHPRREVYLNFLNVFMIFQFLLKMSNIPRSKSLIVCNKKASVSFRHVQADLWWGHFSRLEHDWRGNNGLGFLRFRPLPMANFETLIIQIFIFQI